MAKAPRQARQHRGDRVLRRCSTLDFACDQVTDDFRIGLALKLAALGDQLVAQQLEILDNAIVDQRDRPDDMRVRVADGRRAVGRPARVGDAGGAVKRVAPRARERGCRAFLPPSAARACRHQIVQMPAKS